MTDKKQIISLATTRLTEGGEEKNENNKLSEVLQTEK